MRGDSIVRRYYRRVIRWLGEDKPFTKAMWATVAVAFLTLLATLLQTQCIIRQNQTALQTTAASLNLQEIARSNAFETLRLEQATRLNPELECILSISGSYATFGERYVRLRNVGTAPAEDISLEIFFAGFTTNAVRFQVLLDQEEEGTEEFSPHAEPAGPKVFYKRLFSGPIVGAGGPAKLGPGETGFALPALQHIGLGFADWFFEAFGDNMVLSIYVTYSRHEPGLRTYGGYWFYGYDAFSHGFADREHYPLVDSIVERIDSCSQNSRFLVYETAPKLEDWTVVRKTGAFATFTRAFWAKHTEELPQQRLSRVK